MRSLTCEALRVKRYMRGVTCEALRVKCYMRSVTRDVKHSKRYMRSATCEALRAKFYVRSVTCVGVLREAFVTYEAVHTKHYERSVHDPSVIIKEPLVKELLVIISIVPEASSPSPIAALGTEVPGPRLT